jgi:hypothetical protein
MKPTKREKAFLEQLQTLFEQNGGSMDPERRERNHLDRLAALTVPAASKTRRRATRIVTLGVALATAAVMVISAAALILRPPAPPPVPEALLADVDILSAGDPLDFYEDLVFYQWLAEATRDAGN